MAGDIEMKSRLGRARIFATPAVLTGGPASLGGEKFKTTTTTIDRKGKDGGVVSITTEYQNRARGLQFPTPVVTTTEFALPATGKATVKLPSRGVVYLGKA